MAPSRTPYRVILAGILMTPFIVLAALVLLGFSDDLDRALSPHPGDLPLSAFPPTLIQTASTYHNRPPPAVPSLARALTRRLVPPGDRSLNAHLKRIAYPILLSLRHNREEILACYLNRAGFARAAKACFGIAPEHLTAGEAALLCHLALTEKDTLLDRPEAALNLRDRLLTHLRDTGLLSPEQYRAEIDRPLALASDHRPIR